MSSLRLDIQLVVIDTEYNEELKSVAQRGGSDVTQHLSTAHRNANTERTHACEESTPERSRTSQPPTFCRQTRGWDRRWYVTIQKYGMKATRSPTVARSTSQ